MRRSPKLGLFYFAADAGSREQNKYRLLLESGKLADELGLVALWVPERHFQQFGGLYGSPSVTAAALAVVTKRIQLRAGSVVMPLQNPLRVAEEWAMIDNLSGGGRVGIAIASGWAVDDFVLNPPAFTRKHEDCAEKLAIVQTLWKGDKVSLPNGVGHEVQIGILPKPIQPTLPIWLTTPSDDGFKLAGRLGHNVLTANFSHGHDRDTLAARITMYREELSKHHGHAGIVTLMVHTYVGGSDEEVQRVARPAMEQYVRTSIPLFANQDVEGPERAALRQIEERRRSQVVAMQTSQNLSSGLSFVGTVESCRDKAEAMAAIGVDELACLIDFGIPHEETMASVRRLADING